jgi:hypothetical protein
MEEMVKVQMSDWATEMKWLEEEAKMQDSSRPVQEKKRLPDLNSAAEMFNRTDDYCYIEYMCDFRSRHPILFWLFYRWWFLLSVDKNLRQYLVKEMKLRRSPEFSWHVYAIYHPVLFLLWLALYTVFQGIMSVPSTVIEGYKYITSRQCTRK